MGKFLIHITPIIITGLILLLLSGCGDEGCTEPTISYTIANIQQVRTSESAGATREGTEGEPNPDEGGNTDGNGGETGGEGEVPVVTTLKTISIYTIGYKNDTTLISGQSDMKTIALRLNPDTTYTRLRLRFEFNTDTISDTLSFYYKNREFFLSLDCGCSVYNYLDSIIHTENVLKNIDINNPEVTNEKKPNITFYY